MMWGYTWELFFDYFRRGSYVFGGQLLIYLSKVFHLARWVQKNLPEWVQQNVPIQSKKKVQLTNICDRDHTCCDRRSRSGFALPSTFSNSASNSDSWTGFKLPSCCFIISPIHLKWNIQLSLKKGRKKQVWYRLYCMNSRYCEAIQFPSPSR